MDQNANTHRSEDTTRAERHVENAAENRDALARENRAVEATTSAPMPRNPAGQTGGDSRGSEDNVENVEHAAENRDALAAQARRVERTAPPEVDLPNTPERG